MNINDFIRENSFLNNEELLRRFAERVVDLCAENATVEYRSFNHPEAGADVDKESILYVKKLLV